MAGGEVPQWPLGSGYTGGMVGDPADIVFADALIRGIGVELVDEVDVLGVEVGHGGLLGHDQLSTGLAR